MLSSGSLSCSSVSWHEHVWGIQHPFPGHWSVFLQYSSQCYALFRFVTQSCCEQSEWLKIRQCGAPITAWNTDYTGFCVKKLLKLQLFAVKTVSLLLALLFHYSSSRSLNSVIRSVKRWAMCCLQWILIQIIRVICFCNLWCSGDIRANFCIVISSEVSLNIVLSLAALSFIWYSAFFSLALFTASRLAKNSWLARRQQ